MAKERRNSGRDEFESFTSDESEINIQVCLDAVRLDGGKQFFAQLSSRVDLKR